MARVEFRDAFYATSKTNDITYDVKVTIRPDVFFISSGRLAINYGFSLFNIFKGTDPMFAWEDGLYICWAAKLFIAIISTK